MENKVLKIVSWNVRGCRRKVKRDEIDEILVANDVMIAALQEINTIGDDLSTNNYRWQVPTPTFDAPISITIPTTISDEA